MLTRAKSKEARGLSVEGMAETTSSSTGRPEGHVPTSTQGHVQSQGNEKKKVYSIKKIFL